MPETWRTDYTVAEWTRPVLTEFCGAYKGDHYFEGDSKVCRCGRARK